MRTRSIAAVSLVVSSLALLAVGCAAQTDDPSSSAELTASQSEATIGPIFLFDFPGAHAGHRLGDDGDLDHRGGLEFLLRVAFVGTAALQVQRGDA